MFRQLLDALLAAKRLKQLGRRDLLPSAAFRSIQTSARLAAALLPVRPRTVFDGGFHKGAFSHALSLIYPNITVCGCDPFDWREDWQYHPSKFFNVALGSVSTVGQMRLVNDPELHSLLPLNELHANSFGPSYRQITEMKSVEVRALDELMEETGWEECDLLKLDVQGSELDVLRGAGQTVTRIGAIYLEVSFVHLYHGQSLFADVASFLNAYGFRLARIINGRGGDYLLQADALFLNTCFYPSSVFDEKPIVGDVG